MIPTRNVFDTMLKIITSRPVICLPINYSVSKISQDDPTRGHDPRLDGP